MEKMLLVSEVAKILRVCGLHVRNLITRGDLIAYKEGNRGGYRIFESSVEEYVSGKIEDYKEERIGGKKKKYKKVTRNGRVVFG